MPTPPVCRKFLPVVLLVVLAGAWPASAAGSLRENIPSARAGEWVLPEIFGRFWSFLQRLEAKEGCRIDPWGQCAAKDGCHIDPHGRCVQAQNPVPQSKPGCLIDPWGRCLP